MDVIAENEKNESIRLIIQSTIPDALQYPFDNSTQVMFAPTGNFGAPDVLKSNSCGFVSGNIVITERGDFFLSGTFNGKVCLSTGEQKQISNGIINAVQY